MDLPESIIEQVKAGTLTDVSGIEDLFPLATASATPSSPTSMTTRASSSWSRRSWKRGKTRSKKPSTSCTRERRDATLCLPPEELLDPRRSRRGAAPGAQPPDLHLVARLAQVGAEEHPQFSRQDQAGARGDRVPDRGRMEGRGHDRVRGTGAPPLRPARRIQPGQQRSRNSPTRR